MANSGPGSLRACIESRGPRTCVFEISGHIRLLSDLLLQDPFITIAGQSAPSPGIMLSGATIRISTHDVLIQHLSLRPGDENSQASFDNRDGVGIRSDGSDVFNIVLDHLSISWATDENIGIYSPVAGAYVRDVTISNSILAEGLYRSKNSKGAHSMGLLVGEYTYRIAILRNLFAHNHKRNPMLKGGVSAQVINNVVYNWRGELDSAVANVSNVEEINQPVFLNFIGNVYKPGTNSPLFAALRGTPVFNETRVNLYDNFGPTRQSTLDPEWNITSLPEIPHRSLNPVLPIDGLSLLSAEEATSRVISSSGARVMDRSATSVDERIVSDVLNVTGDLKDCVSGCSKSAGGFPAYSVNTRTFPLPPDPYGDSDLDGYTNLEEILHEMSSNVEGMGSQ